MYATVLQAGIFRINDLLLINTIVVGIALLIGAWYDYRYRNVPLWIWQHAMVVCVPVTVLLAFSLAWIDGKLFFAYGAIVGIVFFITLVAWNTGQFGGADATALTLIAIFVPLSPFNLTGWNVVPLLTVVIAAGISLPWYVVRGLKVGIRNALEEKIPYFVVLLPAFIAAVAI